MHTLADRTVESAFISHAHLPRSSSRTQQRGTMHTPNSRDELHRNSAIRPWGPSSCEQTSLKRGTGPFEYERHRKELNETAVQREARREGHVTLICLVKAHSFATSNAPNISTYHPLSNASSSRIVFSLQHKLVLGRSIIDGAH